MRSILNTFIFWSEPDPEPKLSTAPTESAAAPAAVAQRAGGKRARNKLDKWQRIEAAARAEFAQHGFDAAGLRAIAARARVATGTLFLYARDKRELLFLVFQGEARRIFAEAEADATDAHDAPLADSLMTLFGRFFAFYARSPELSAAIVREFFFRPYEPERLGALTREYAAQLVRRVERARARGELRGEVPAAVAANALFAHYAYWVQAWLGSRLVSREQAEQRLREGLQLQIDGLRAPSERARAEPRPRRGARRRPPEAQKKQQRRRR